MAVEDRKGSTGFEIRDRLARGREVTFLISHLKSDLLDQRASQNFHRMFFYPS